MANTKISALTALTGADLANDDAFAVVDTSATATKKITVAEMKLGIMPAPGPIGGTTPSTGAFTTISATTGAAVGGATAGTGGLAFPATAVAVADANTLDDYEEGSFTPAANAVTYSAATGRYTKIGNVVTIIFSITFPATADTAHAQITNLPFTVSTGSSVALSGYTTDVNGQATDGTTILRFIKADSSAYKTNASLSTQGLVGTLVYRV